MESVKSEEIKVGQTLMVTENLRTGDRSYIGMPLEVVAVDLPYIIVERDSWFNKGRDKTTMLTSEYCFAVPSADFLEALKAKSKE